MRPPANFALRVAVDRAARDRMTFRNAPRGPVAARPGEAGPRPSPSSPRGLQPKVNRG